ncbi:hypothetical protein B0H11DRAFT_1910404 [Mycena galericulata]|nr:hypothetical protein B0H11DRAFT_1910404 [Mycena galericulata]
MYNLGGLPEFNGEFRDRTATDRYWQESAPPIEIKVRLRSIKGPETDQPSNIRGAGNGIIRHWSALSDVEIQWKPLAPDGSHWSPVGLAHVLEVTVFHWLLLATSQQNRSKTKFLSSANQFYGTGVHRSTVDSSDRHGSGDPRRAPVTGRSGYGYGSASEFSLDPRVPVWTRGNRVPQTPGVHRRARPNISTQKFAGLIGRTQRGS